MRMNGAYQVRLKNAVSDVPTGSVGDAYPLPGVPGDMWLCQFTDFTGATQVLRVVRDRLEIIDRPPGT